MEIRAFRTEDESAVVALWERCGLIRPWNDPRKDIARKITVQPELFLVGLAHRVIVATVMAGYDGHRGWVNYLAVAPECQRQGLGRSMMHEVERLLRVAGCPKVNLQVRDTNMEALGFYSALGYGRDEVVSMGKRLETDDRLMASSPLTELLKLPASDRAELAMALWESLNEAEREGAFELSDADRAELDRRWAEHLKNPKSVIPWAEVRAKLQG